jgi:hypothetical protein
MKKILFIVISFLSVYCFGQHGNPILGYKIDNGNSQYRDSLVAKAISIGSRAPIRPLTIDSAAGAQVMEWIRNRSSNGWSATSYLNETGTAGFYIGVGGSTAVTLPNMYGISADPFTTIDFALGGTRVLTLEHTSLNVGVNKPNPEAGLHVDGTVRLDLGSDAKWDMWQRDSATGNFARIAIGTTGQVLTVVNNKAEWMNPAGGGGSNHNMLSTTHTDATVGTVARGDLITGQGGSPTWTRLPRGTANQIFQSDGTDIGWVTMSGDAALAAGVITVANDAITFAKFQNISPGQFLGRTTAGNGDVELNTVENGLSFSANKLIWNGALTQNTSITGASRTRSVSMTDLSNFIINAGSGAPGNEIEMDNAGDVLITSNLGDLFLTWNNDLKFNLVSNDDTEDKLLTWNSTDKTVQYRTVASLGGGGFTTEDAQDAVGAMINASLQYVDATPLLAINDRDFGDLTTTGSGLTMTLDANVVTYAKLQQASAGFTIMAKASTGAGNYAELAAGADGVLRRSGSGDLAFGTLVTGNIGDAQITYAKIANGTGLSVIGRSANSAGVNADIVGTADQVLRVNSGGTALGFGTVSNAGLTNSSITINGTSVSLGGTRTLTLESSDFANQGTTTTVLHGNAAGNPTWGAVSLSADVSGDLPFSNLTQIAGFSILGKSTTGTGDAGAITASADQVLRRSGSGDLVFGTLVTNNIGDDQITYAKFQNAGANEVIGRSAGTTGDVSGIAIGASQLFGRGATGDLAPITLGTNLSMSGTTLNATGGSGSSAGSTGDVQYSSNGAGGFGAEAPFNYVAASNQLTVPGLDVTEDFALTGDISPAQLTADQNDWAPTNHATNSTIRFNTDAARNITGLAGGADGVRRTLHNVGSFSSTFVAESASSTAANRFAGTDLTVGAGQSVTFRYDATSSRWRPEDVNGVLVTITAGATGDWFKYNSTNTTLVNFVPFTVNTTSVGNVGTGEDDLMTDVISGGTLAADGDVLSYEATVTFAANTANKQVRAKFGATTFYASGVMQQNGGSLKISVKVIRTGAATQRIMWSVNSEAMNFQSTGGYTTAGETLSGSVTFKLTGEATSNDDIINTALFRQNFIK